MNLTINRSEPSYNSILFGFIITYLGSPRFILLHGKELFFMKGASKMVSKETQLKQPSCSTSNMTFLDVQVVNLIPYQFHYFQTLRNGISFFWSQIYFSWNVYIQGEVFIISWFSKANQSSTTGTYIFSFRIKTH